MLEDKFGPPAGATFNLSILECKYEFHANGLIATSAFNLSILECKLFYLIFKPVPTHPFNLSILECKCVQVSHGWSSIMPFNLSILECKCRNFCSAPFGFRLLISPYWNVNQHWPLKHLNTLPLLISPYWNVNESSDIWPEWSKATFNLSILECKWHYSAHNVDLLLAFNLSILECKYCCNYLGRNCRNLLISPYWNVNQRGMASKTYGPPF